MRYDLGIASGAVVPAQPQELCHILERRFIRELKAAAWAAYDQKLNTKPMDGTAE